MKINYTTHPPLTYLGAVHALLQKYGFKIGSCGRLWYNGKGEVLAVWADHVHIFVRSISSWSTELSIQTDGSFLIGFRELEAILKTYL